MTATKMEDNALVRSYDRVVENLAHSAGDGWEVIDQPTGGLIWRQFLWRDQDIPAQGWKIHISVAAIEAPEIFETIVPLIFDHQVSFKVPRTIHGVVALNSGEAGNSQLGKIITVFPSNEEDAATLAIELDRACPSSRGPIVSSDVLLREAGAVSLRFGAFGGGEILFDSIGRPTLALRLPDGSLAADNRNGTQPDFAPALSVPHILPSEPHVMQEIFIDGKRYLPLALLYNGPLSRVTLGLEIDDCETVALKTVRKGVGGDLRGYDARDRLHNEYEILTALIKEEIAPRPLAFLDGDPVVLVESDIAGDTVDKLPKSIQIRTLPDLAEAVARLHGNGFAHRDIKLSNVLTNNESIKLIDFGLAARIGSQLAPLGGTGGYLPPEGSAGCITGAEDVHALGVCIAHALLGFDPAALARNSGRLVGLLHLSGAHVGASIVKDLIAVDPRRRPSAGEVAARLKERSGELGQLANGNHWSTPGLASRSWCKRAAWEAAAATREFIEQSDQGHTWRNSHFLSDFQCEAINLGAAGIILGLVSIDQALRRSSFNHDINAGADWLAARPSVPNSSGLFTGNAGVALALALAGSRLSRPQLINCARSRLIDACNSDLEYDLFCGAAGVLVAGCIMADILDDDWPLELIESKAKSLLEVAKILDGVIVWPPSKTLDSSDAPYTGAAHGSAGIAMALAMWGKRVVNNEAVGLAVETFRTLRVNASTNNDKLCLRVENNSKPAPIGSWCHGVAGYLWCALQGLGDDQVIRTEIDWATKIFAGISTAVDNPTYCHGLSGHLELWRMLSNIPRYHEIASEHAAKVATTLRLLLQRMEGKCVWCSDDPGILTPDLWIGFLAPATALALYAVDYPGALLSPDWFRQCGESRTS